jgi:hypothetical protein
MSVCGRIMTAYMQRSLMANDDRNFGLKIISHTDVDSLRSTVTLCHFWTEHMAIHPPTHTRSYHQTIPKKHDLYIHYLRPSLRVFKTNSVTTERNKHYSLIDRGSQRVIWKYWFIFVCLFLARQPPTGQGLPIHEVSRSHTTSHHSR